MKRCYEVVNQEIAKNIQESTITVATGLVASAHGDSGLNDSGHRTLHPWVQAGHLPRHRFGW